MQFLLENTVKQLLETRNICLIGFMGSGKSFVGDYLSKDLNRKLIDSDKEIEKIEKMTISEIFQAKGEKYFRALEKKVLQDIVYTHDSSIPILLATGGGLPIKLGNQKLLKLLEPLIICLNPPFEVIMQRIKGSKRPLLYRRSRQFIFKMWLSRYAVYQKLAHIMITDVIIDDIFKALNERVVIFLNNK